MSDDLYEMGQRIRVLEVLAEERMYERNAAQTAARDAQQYAGLLKKIVDQQKVEIEDLKARLAKAQEGLSERLVRRMAANALTM